jgi:protein-disulfide isomerase
MTASNKPGGSTAAALGGWRGAGLAALVGLLIGGAGVAAWRGGGGGATDRAGVEKIVRAYLLEHPEVLREASERLEQRELGKIVAANRAAYETPFAGAWAGATDGDVVLVEFFDYACGYCRKSNADIDRLLKEDPKLKVVWREWPVLGPDSEEAALVSLAAARQGRYRLFYDRLFALGRPDARAVAEAQRAAGISPQLVAQVKGSDAARGELAGNLQLAQAIGASGTPTFVVGDRVLQGAVGYEALRDAIAEARGKA